MLSDRSYMRNDYPRETTSVLTWILCALVAGFVVQNIFGRWLGNNSIDALFGLTLGGMRHGYMWSLLTYTLLHTSILHLLFNALGFFFLGREILPLIGARRFLGVLAAAAVTGALLWLAVHFLNGHPGELVGASGSVMAVFIIFACIYADREITFLLFFLIPITVKPRYLAWIIVGLDTLGFLFSEIPGGAYDTGVAYSAHLGGMLVGWIYFRYVHASQGLDRASKLTLPSWLRRSPKRPAAGAVSTGGAARRPNPALRAEVDRILDKINSQGFGSLTEEEKRLLDEAKDLLSRH